MIDTKAKQQLNRLNDSIQQTGIKELEQQRERLAAYADRYEADMEEDTDIATTIRELESYLSDRADSYIATMNSIGKLLTGRDAVAEWAAANGFPYAKCGADQ